MKKSVVTLLAVMFFAVVVHLGAGIGITFAAGPMELKLAEIHPKGYPTELETRNLPVLLRNAPMVALMSPYSPAVSLVVTRKRLSNRSKWAPSTLPV